MLRLTRSNRTCCALSRVHLSRLAPPTTAACFVPLRVPACRSVASLAKFVPARPLGTPIAYKDSMEQLLEDIASLEQAKQWKEIVSLLATCREERKELTAKVAHAALQALHKGRQWELLLKAVRYCAHVLGTESFNLALLSFQQLQSAKGCYELFRTLEIQGVTPNRDSYNITVQTCALFGELAWARELIAEMEVKNIPLVALSYTAYLTVAALVESPNFEEIFRLLRVAENKIQDPDVVTYNAIIAAATEHGRFADAVSVFQRLRSRKFIQPNKETLSLAIDAMQRAGRNELAEELAKEAEVVEDAPSLREIVAQLEASDCSLTSLSYSIVLSGCAKQASPDIDDILRVLKLAEKRQQDPDVLTYNAVIEAASQQGRFSDALSVFDRMQKKSVVLPNKDTYSLMMDAMTRAGRQDIVDKLKRDASEAFPEF